jgi:hypothetical protein
VRGGFAPPKLNLPTGVLGFNWKIQMPPKINRPGSAICAALSAMAAGVAMLAIYALTLNPWVTVANLMPVAKVSGYLWQPELYNPLMFLFDVSVPLAAAGKNSAGVEYFLRPVRGGNLGFAGAVGGAAAA